MQNRPVCNGSFGLGSSAVPSRKKSRLTDQISLALSLPNLVGGPCLWPMTRFHLSQAPHRQRLDRLNWSTGGLKSNLIPFRGIALL